MNIKLKNLISAKIEYLEKLKLKIDATYLKPIEIDDLEKYDESQFPLALPQKGDTTIYIIKTNTNLDHNKINKKRNDLAKEGYQMSRVIGENWDNNKENCLYAGRSNDIKSRLKQHLFLERKSTYALRLKKLLKKGQITIEIYKFGNDSKEVQIFEDLLWEHYRPLFGRQGSK